MAAKIWGSPLPFSVRCSSHRSRPFNPPATPGVWATQRRCGGAPVLRVRGGGGSNPPQVPIPKKPAACKHTTGDRVQEWHANESFCMCHGTCKSSGAVEVANRCPTVEDIAEFQGNVLNSGGISIWGTQGRTRYMVAHLRGCSWRPCLEIPPGATCTASTPVSPMECEWSEVE